jgi:K+-transporting ATPase KdpF subunit
MDVGNLLAAVLATAVLIYLLYAMLRPEQF